LLQGQIRCDTFRRTSGARQQYSDSAGRGAIFGFLSFAEVNTFAKTMAALITERYPPVIANNPEYPVPPQRVSEILEVVLARAPRFQRENRLGFLARAKLRNAFREELREIGYGEGFIGLATAKLIQQLTRTTD
jgi:hypothetical protein